MVLKELFTQLPKLTEGRKGNGIKRRSINSEFGKKVSEEGARTGGGGFEWMIEGGNLRSVPAPLITLDLLEMLMSCWVIAHVRPWEPTLR